MNGEQLSKRINATKELRGIVSTMKMLSSVSLNGYTKASLGISRYNQVLILAFQALLQTGFSGQKGQNKNKACLFVLIGSDNGLVGSFNKNLFRAFETAAQKEGAAQKFFMCIGRRVNLMAGQYHIKPLESFPVSNVIEEIANMASHLLLHIQHIKQAHKIEKALLIYNTKRNGHTQVKTEVLLPLSPTLYTTPSLEKKDFPNALIDMNTYDFFNALAHEYLTMQLAKAIIRSLECEHYTRMINMRQAEKNIDEKIADMDLAYAEMRQTEITDELIDIISGAESLKKEKTFP